MHRLAKVGNSIQGCIEYPDRLHGHPVFLESSLDLIDKPLTIVVFFKLVEHSSRDHGRLDRLALSSFP